MSPLFRSQAYRRGRSRARRETPEVATKEWKKLLESWEDPGLDEGIDAELQEFMAERKRELDE